MAKVIEYYVPEEFGKRSRKWIHSEQCGKIIPYPRREKKSAREPAGLLALRESNGAELGNCSAYVCERIAREGTHECFGDNVETNCELSELAKCPS